jgi:hypothetical protein
LAAKHQLEDIAKNVVAKNVVAMNVVAMNVVAMNVVERGRRKGTRGSVPTESANGRGQPQTAKLGISEN